MAAKNTPNSNAKKNTAKKSGTAKTGAAKSSAAKKTGTKAQNSKKAQAAADAKKAARAKENRRFWSYILFFVGIFELFATFIKGDGLWNKLYCFNRGVFGISVFLFAPMLIYVALMIASDYNKNKVLAKLIEGSVLMLLFSGAAQILQVGSVEGASFLRKVEWLYDNGVKLKGGGVASAFLGWPLLAAFKRVGAAIIIILMAFTFIMLLTDITLPQFFKAVTKPFRSGYKAVSEDRYDRAERAAERNEAAPEKPEKKPRKGVQLPPVNTVTNMP
ncbi:MAG: hypothetical protein II574_08200, partial [Ruminococcus sp.]|nr:hypothetical protein [Ruminococcus sp.]